MLVHAATHPPVHPHPHAPGQVVPGSVGELAATRPRSVKVLQRHRIDFCCGGRVALAHACAEKGITEAQLLAEVAALDPTETSDTHWVDAPLAELIDHILAVHHAPLPQELDRLCAMADRVLQVHGGRDFERLSAVHDLTHSLRDDLLPHMVKEEEILFPWLRFGQSRDASGPIQVMEMEHAAVGELLHQLRERTNHYRAPMDACMTWQALWHGLAELEADLMQHIHLENNILFPRARDRQR